MSILVITTGGTIGAMPYDDLKHQERIKTMPPDARDFVAEALRTMPFSTRCIEMDLRDSNFIDEPYRLAMAEHIAKAVEKNIIVTHGTDTLLQTADYLTHSPLIKDKSVIITGAMVALSCGPESDGMQNLRFSLDQLDAGALKAGVYIVLSDYSDEAQRTGWVPKLYPYQSGRYTKYYDPDDSSRCRLIRA